VRLLRSGKTLGKRTFAIAGGQSQSVSVKLSKSARKMLSKHRSLRIRISATGADSAGSSIAASQRVKLKR
jgi:hypothetical protein